MTPDGRRVVSASDDQTLKVWDLETGRELRHAAKATPRWVTACAVTPDGRRVVSASADDHAEGVGPRDGARGWPPWKGHAARVSAAR